MRIEQKLIDYRVLILLRDNADSTDYYYYDLTFEDVFYSYLKTSGSALYDERDELYDLFSEIRVDDMDGLTADIDFGHYGDAASTMLDLLADDDVPDGFKDILQEAYGEEFD